jgi:hypothetical protein
MTEHPIQYYILLKLLYFTTVWDNEYVNMWKVKVMMSD